MKVRFWEPEGRSPRPDRVPTTFAAIPPVSRLTAATATWLILDAAPARAPLARVEADWQQSVHASIWSEIRTGSYQGFPFFSPVFRRWQSVAIYGPEGSRSSLMTCSRTDGVHPLPHRVEPAAGVLTYHDLSEGIHTIACERSRHKFLNHSAMTLGYRVKVDGVVVVTWSPRDHTPTSSGAPAPNRVTSTPFCTKATAGTAKVHGRCHLLIHDAPVHRQRSTAQRKFRTQHLRLRGADGARRACVASR